MIHPLFEFQLSQGAFLQWIPTCTTSCCSPRQDTFYLLREPLGTLISSSCQSFFRPSKKIMDRLSLSIFIRFRSSATFAEIGLITAAVCFMCCSRLPYDATEDWKKRFKEINPSTKTKKCVDVHLACMQHAI